MDKCNLIAEVTTAATFMPVTLQEAKKQVELSSTDTAHDDQLIGLILSAADEVHRDTGLYLCEQTLRVKIDSIDDGLQLHGQPISSITSIKYYDSANVQQTVATTIYSFDTANRTIRLKYGQTWPSAISRWDAWEIIYVAGHSSQAAIPQLAKKACLLLIANDFADRGDMVKESEQRKYERVTNKLNRGTYP